MNIILGIYIHEMRIQKEITLRRLAQALGITAQEMSEIEAGYNTPSSHMVDTLIRLWKLTEQETGQLWNLVEKAKPKTKTKAADPKEVAVGKLGIALRSVWETRGRIVNGFC